MSADSAEELFERAPCGYLTTTADGTIVRVNRTFEEWTGLRREDLAGARRFSELLTAGGRIYHETHVAPLLRMQGAVRAIAVEVVRADGSRLPALVNAAVDDDDVVLLTVFDATDRRSYERELMAARERERDVALELQRSLLAGALPSDARVRTEVVLRPAERAHEVGGDWYDAFALEAADAVAVVLGDVVGRGIGAAATMGQLRSAIRALASTGLGPGALLGALDRYARRHEVGQMATIALAHVDLTTRCVTYACAGHPPPVLVEPGAPPRFLDEGRSLPLDAYGVRERAEATVDLPRGGTLVLYSDGLIERRDRTMTDGMAALLEAVAREPSLEAVTDVMLDRDAAPDDVCAIALHVAGA